MTKVKKESNKKFLILLLIVLLLVLAIGYAAFSDTLQISGTANAKGSFDIRFVDDEDDPGNGCVVSNSAGCTATVSVEADANSDADDKLVVTVQNLAYPGAGATVHAVVKNFGTIPVKIDEVSATPSGNSNAIKVYGLDVINSNHDKIDADGTCEFDFTIMWDPTVTTLNPAKAGEDVADTTNVYSFTFDVDYIQDTETFDTTRSHSDTTH